MWRRAGLRQNAIAILFSSQTAARERRRIVRMTKLGSTILFVKLAPAVAISALLAVPAHAQLNSLKEPPVVLPTDFPSAPVIQNQQIKRARENAYRRALKKIPDKKNAQPADPWANMRSTASSKSGQQ
ncbi:MAG: hypothetical protein ACREB8_12490 [Pseudolabrys sp.]